MQFSPHRYHVCDYIQSSLFKQIPRQLLVLLYRTYISVCPSLIVVGYQSVTVVNPPEPLRPCTGPPGRMIGSSRLCNPDTQYAPGGLSLGASFLDLPRMLVVGFALAYSGEVQPKSALHLLLSPRQFTRTPLTMQYRLSSPLRYRAVNKRQSNGNQQTSLERCMC